MRNIVILGGGFGGIYTAMYLEKYLSKAQMKEYKIILINRENYFVYQPMLAEVVGGSVGILDTVSSIRKLLPKTALYIREIEKIDTDNKVINLAPRFSHTTDVVPYDKLVVGLGNVTDFHGMAGLHEHALPFKNLADALNIRNRIIDTIEQASIETDPIERKQLLTFVVGGGGFSGTEVVAELNDFVRKLAKKYKTIDKREIRVVLVHSKDRLMEKELSESLGIYAEKLLKKRGVEIIFNTHLLSASQQEALLDNGDHIPAKTIISTVPSSPNPLIKDLNLELSHGRVVTDMGMQAIDKTDVWAIGDCALIPQEEGGFCPPTAQFAIREAKVLAQNVIARIENKASKNFKFKALGMLGALGHHSAVAELFGKIKFSGILAWIFWRAIYWIKLPGIDRKIKVAFSWMLDMLIPQEAVQLKIEPSQGIASLHFEKDEVIFHQGDVGDYLYIITEGSVEVLREQECGCKRVATLSKGEYFGEMALVHQKTRSATIKCLESTNVLALKKSDFGLLVANFSELRESFEKTSENRKNVVNE
ncbi:MAG: FAD-dependent oxidoreductase [Rhabdochlamydiaceae bacterium]|nr:FAD-dependent oxidoreductase [Candidatus Amphrikana amoebophyrae]